MNVSELLCKTLRLHTTGSHRYKVCFIVARVQDFKYIHYPSDELEGNDILPGGTSFKKLVSIFSTENSLFRQDQLVHQLL